MIIGFESGGEGLIWITLMTIGALLWEINKNIKHSHKNGCEEEK